MDTMSQVCHMKPKCTESTLNCPKVWSLKVKITAKTTKAFFKLSVIHSVTQSSWIKTLYQYQNLCPVNTQIQQYNMHVYELLETH